MTAATPRGFRDILPREALARERITDVVRGCFSEHGYLPVETPLLEERAALEKLRAADQRDYRSGVDRYRATF